MNKTVQKAFAAGILFLLCKTGFTQSFSRADSLRGSIGPGRSWWNVQHYDLRVYVDIASKTIRGRTTISFATREAGTVFQVDLQKPLTVDSVIYHKKSCQWKADGYAYLVALHEPSTPMDSVSIYYSGKPQEAKMPPWDGGLVWKEDAKGRPWVGVSCQGLGASIWWPNKDHLSDEPDKGMRISVTIPDSLVNISNGRLKETKINPDKTITWVYEVVNPINNYDVTLNIANYITVKDTFNGKKGLLDIEYVVLDYNADKVKTHLQQDTKDMLACFEHWFGPYPFYEDGFRLVETSYLGMEHQSAIAYGNQFKKGYKGRDRSGSGEGLFWDYIIIHESGHEWFGNNITAKDIADMWIQESFTTYSEVLFVECMRGKEAGNKYVAGLRKNIANDKSIIGHYGVNTEGSNDQYDKGANMIHILRQIMDDDIRFRELLNGLTREFGKKTVTTEEIEKYISSTSGKDFAPVFDQYLRTSKIPLFEYRLKGNELEYRWNNVVKNFSMPLKVFTGGRKAIWLYPTADWQKKTITGAADSFEIDGNFYIESKKLKN